MVTRRNHLGHWTESKRVVVVGGEPVVKQVTCACALAAAPAKDCAKAAGNKTPCRCFCHSKKLK